MIVAAHSDDEVLGCGGTIARHVSEGDVVEIVFLADGVMSRADCDIKAIKARENAAKAAHKILGISHSVCLGMPDNKMDSLSLLDIVKPLEEVIQGFLPDLIYTHHNGDLNIDHRLTHQAVMTACRPVPGYTVREIYSFEVMSSTEWNPSGVSHFLPNYFIDISNDFLEKKLLALKEYSMEMRKAPHSRSFEHVEYLARHRGYSVGLEAAEAFMTIRRLN